MFRPRHVQPSIPPEIELFFENERGRIALEVEGVTTTTNRALVASGLEASFQAAQHFAEHPSEQRAREAYIAVRAMQASLITDSIIQTVNEMPEYLSQSPDERAKSETYREKAKLQGGLILHGLRVSNWSNRHEGIRLTDDNLIAAAVSNGLIHIFEKKRTVKKLGRIMRYI